MWRRLFVCLFIRYEFLRNHRCRPRNAANHHCCNHHCSNHLLRRRCLGATKRAGSMPGVATTMNCYCFVVSACRRHPPTIVERRRLVVQTTRAIRRSTGTGCRTFWSPHSRTSCWFLILWLQCQLQLDSTRILRIRQRRTKAVVPDLSGSSNCNHCW